MKAEDNPQLVVLQAEVPLERDMFLRTLIRELMGTLQEVVGLEEAAGLITVAAQRMGEEINSSYRDALHVDRLPASHISAVLVDLKRRINGSFYVIEEDESHIVLGNRQCPFGDKVRGRPSLCMMTSNVFGVIASESVGYARVSIEEAIANGDPGCRVVIYLKRDENNQSPSGREYFRS